MSVPKSRRGESPAEYINLAREIYVFTYNRVRILPKSYTFYFSLPLYNAAREAYRMIKTANLIYVDEKSPEEIRRRNIQRRKEYYETAQGYYNSMLDVLDLAYMTVNHEKIFAYLAITGQTSQEFMTVYTVVIAFYFGTQTQKISDAVDKTLKGE